MPSHPPPRRRTSERLAAWTLTGPLGHFYSAAADVGVLGFRYLRWRAGRRVRRMFA